MTSTSPATPPADSSSPCKLKSPEPSAYSAVAAAVSLSATSFKRFRSGSESCNTASISSGSAAAARNVDNHGDCSSSEQEDTLCPPVQPSMCSAADFAKVDQAIQLLEDACKAAYMEAKERCPHLIIKESNPALYLFFTKFDVREAASRICEYWTRRREAFEGGKRAFLSLTDWTGNGALDHDDLEILRSGIVIPVKDLQGRSGLFVDPSRVERPDCEINDMRVRNMFFWFYYMSQNPLTAKEGIVILRNVTKKSVDRQKVLQLQKIFTLALPFSTRETHICSLPPPGGRKTFSAIVVPVFLALMGTIFGRSTTLITHACDRPEEMAQKLAVFFDLDFIPESVGGFYRYEKFNILLKQQMLKHALDCKTAVVSDDEKMPATTSVQQQDLSTVAAAVAKVDSPVRSSCATRLSDSSPSRRVSERKVGKRKLDSIRRRVKLDTSE